MPAISPSELVDAILDAIRQSGNSAVLLGKVREHPRKFAIAIADGHVELWVYAWTLTFGGRTNLPNEFRIQMTTVASPLPLNPNGPTALIGFHPDTGMFAGFDLARHRTFTSGSPSVQIDIRTVKDAMQHGLTFDRKTNHEIAVGIRPDQFISYILNADALHRHGRNTGTFNLLKRAVLHQDIPDQDLATLSDKRKRIVQAISTLSRSANFRQQVMFAYGNRCAVTRVQLRLVDAAHLLPVGAPGSPDDVRNGIALAPTYHRAFDAGLIYLSDDYSMRINRERVKELKTLRLVDGLAEFSKHLGRVYLPPDRRQWPNKTLIRKANSYRKIRT